MKYFNILILLFTVQSSLAQHTKIVQYEPPKEPLIEWISPSEDYISISQIVNIKIKIISNCAIHGMELIHNNDFVDIPRGNVVKDNGFFMFSYQLKLKNGNNSFNFKVTNVGNKTSTSLRNIDYNVGKETKIWAVIVGISRYEKKKGLDFSDDDAHRLNTFLSSPEGGAVPDLQRVLLIDEKATKWKILNETRNVFLKAKENDLVLFYFSGHGDKKYFLPYDYNNISYSFLYHSELIDIFNSCKANKKIFIADACHSGSSIGKKKNPTSTIINEYYEGISNSSGFAFITSSKGEEESSEISYFQQGVFSYFLIEGLKGKADTKNREHLNKITIGELFNYIQSNVSNETQNTQTPQIKCSNLDMIISIVRK